MVLSPDKVCKQRSGGERESKNYAQKKAERINETLSWKRASALELSEHQFSFLLLRCNSNTGLPSERQSGKR